SASPGSTATASSPTNEGAREPLGPRAPSLASRRSAGLLGAQVELPHRVEGDVDRGEGAIEVGLEGTKPPDKLTRARADLLRVVASAVGALQLRKLLMVSPQPPLPLGLLGQVDVGEDDGDVFLLIVVPSGHRPHAYGRVPGP